MNSSPAAAVDLSDQVVLAREEGVHGPDREAGELRHLLEGGVVEALPAEDLLGRVEELRAAQVLPLGAALLAAVGTGVGDG